MALIVKRAKGKSRRAQPSPLPRPQEGHRHRRCVPAWSCRAPRATSSCRSSTTPSARPSRRPRPWRRTSAPFDGDKTAKAKKVGELVAERAKAAGVEAVVFDRGGNKYHGRVAAIADGAREGGLSL